MVVLEAMLATIEQRDNRTCAAVSVVVQPFLTQISGTDVDDWEFAAAWDDFAQKLLDLSDDEAWKQYQSDAADSLEGSPIFVTDSEVLLLGDEWSLYAGAWRDYVAAIQAE